MGSTRRAFTDEYKASAVDFVLNDGRPIADVARSIGIHDNTLGNWAKKARDERGGPERPLNENERAELERLREENRRLRMEAEFAKNSGRRGRRWSREKGAAGPGRLVVGFGLGLVRGSRVGGS